MQRQTRSLLQELEDLSNKRDTKHLIESRANNVIASAINLLEMISKNYDSETAELLERKLFNAIRSRNQDRFSNTIRKTKK